MTQTYTSIFDSSRIITQKELRELLNLNTDRSTFTPAEIKKAYHKRALRFHPDKQQQFKQPIPTELCNILMNDIQLAQEYLLNGEDNILGNGLKNKPSVSQATDWADLFISILNSLKDGTSSIESTVSSLYYLSSRILMLLAMSTYSDQQLNLRYINELTPILAIIKPYLKDIDGTHVVSVLHYIRKIILLTEQFDAAKLITEIRSISPEFLNSNIAPEKLDALIVAIRESGDALKNLLTDDFIAQTQHIITFWAANIANLPSWSQLIGVYFTSLIFTATSMPKFFNALKVLSAVIIEQKGVVPFIFFGIPLVLSSLLLLPINIATQLFLPLCSIALRASLQVLSNGTALIRTMLALLLPWLSNNDSTLNVNLFTAFETSFNLTVRLFANIMFELSDAVLFILSNTSLLSSTQEQFNSTVDNWMNSIRPGGDKREPVKAIVVKPKVVAQEAPPVTANTSANANNFFSNTLHNETDVWLDDFLANLDGSPVNSMAA